MPIPDLTLRGPYLHYIRQAQQLADNPQGNWEEGLTLISQAKKPGIVEWTHQAHAHPDFMAELTKLEQREEQRIQSLRKVFHQRHALQLVEDLQTSPTVDKVYKLRMKLGDHKIALEDLLTDPQDVISVERLLTFTLLGAIPPLVEGLRNDTEQTESDKQQRRSRILAYLRLSGCKLGDVDVHPPLARKELRA